ncbi:hypothetical protein [Streptomyces sp. ISL-100]|uniref:hypothetical protein n=1 Tax=Streptomyces sp. ISL-100 TaxID=2819173 RepID=UPI001BEC64EC|nr:hypothetical protein [Streptomyces sp. ISL-100]
MLTAPSLCTTPEVESALRDQRNANLAAIEALIPADIDAGELPRTADARALARFSGAVFQGMSQQARDGATRQELEAVAGHAMRAWSAVAATEG